MTSTLHIKSFLYLAAAVTLAVASASIPLSAAEHTCSDIEVLFARGSGESLRGDNFQSFRAQLDTAFSNHTTNLKVNYHELDYPAAGVSNFIETIITTITLGERSLFSQSVQTGQRNLKKFIQQTSAVCPGTKFVLAGYSQGAMVISKTLPDLKSSQIIYAATFGDPKLYLPEGLGLTPPACQNKKLSNYRQTVPDCHTATGILGALKNYQPSGYKDKLGAWCNAGDFICGSYFDVLGGIMKGHVAYSNNGAYQEAANVILSSTKKFFPTQVSDQIKPNYSHHDIAILIDNTASMDELIERYSVEAIRLARDNISQGGRVALYTYGDIAAGTKPQQLVDFTTDLATFETALKKIKLGGGGDRPESALSGLLYTMNTLKWQKGANKSIVLLTDASYHSPDLDGTTLPQVVQRSLEIDPVNIFIVTEEENLSSYQSLASATGGAVSTIGNATLITDQVSQRPLLLLDQELYVAAPGSTVDFNVTSSMPIQSYEWDLDGDGVFERTTTIGSISQHYAHPLTGYIQVRAVADSGYYSTASANLRVVDFTTSTIKNLLVTKQGLNSVMLSFDAHHAQATLVIADDYLAGYTTNNQFSISDIAKPTTIKLIPISTAGQLGEPATVTVSPANFIPTAPRTGVQ
ncbi:cutinase family protein [Candidatus Saccharibacteria bacterium]|nr:cutinase family protein [Candidatus Saccharibacteria bacterium]